MKISITILLVIVYTSICAQTSSDTLYYDKDWKKTYGPDYSFYRVITPQGDELKVEDHYRNGQIQMSGTYASLAPKEIADGHFMYYTDRGIKTRDEYYKSGLLEGEYFTYDTAGHMILKMYFKHDKWDGARTAYYTSGKVYRDEIYKQGEFVSGHVYDENGKELLFYPREKLPEFPGGDTAMASFIRSHLQYLDTARRLGIAGTVKVQFLIGLDGSIEDVSVAKSDNPLLNEAAIMVVRQLPRFSPAQQEGKSVRFQYLLPIKFKLSNAHKVKK